MFDQKFLTMLETWNTRLMKNNPYNTPMTAERAEKIIQDHVNNSRVPPMLSPDNRCGGGADSPNFVQEA